MQRSGKQNIELPQLQPKHQHSLELRKDIFYIKPKLQRIVYNPIFNPKRKTNNANIMKAYMSNKKYEEVEDEANEDKIHDALYETKIHFDKEERGHKFLIGKEAPLKYYENYKNISKILSKRKAETDHIPSVERDPTTAILQKIQQQKALPRCLGIVKTKGQPSVLDLNGQKLGDKYIKIISAGLKDAKLIESYEFANNRLTDEGFSEIAKNIGTDIIKINVSYNQITKMDQKLINIILEPEARLQYLNLESNLITDSAAEALCRNGSYSRHLKYLNLRKNILSCKCADAICDLINRTVSLEELYIGTNRIFDNGAISIMDSLSASKTIKVFDYSFNKLGQSSPSCAKSLANMLIKNKTLVHFDLSSNNFNAEESKIIGEALKQNKIIYGFHFRGNFGFVDSQGFIVYKEKDLTSLQSLVDTRINSYDIISRRQQIGFEPKVFKNVCWICEGWYEETFKFTTQEEDADGKRLVYIHFDFEEYEPRLINLTEKNVKYKTMVPPKKYKYFFTHNKKQFLDSHPNAKPTTLEFPSNYKYEMYCEETQLIIERVSTREGKAKKIVNTWNQLIVDVMPRQIGLITKKQKIPWSYKDSLWYKQWKIDNEQLIRNCFERDWKHSKLMNFIKNATEQEKAKELLYTHYKFIKELYKYYSSWSPFNGDIWAVANNAYTQFCHEAKIISKEAPLKIIDLTFITTNSMSGVDWKGNSLVPERGLVRFQFMESLVRLADEKYKKNGLSDNILGSIQMLMEQHITPLSVQSCFQSQSWRMNQYFIQENDKLIKKFRPIFTQLYKKNSRLKVKPGHKPFMCLEEFKSLFQRIGVAGNQIQERDINISFNCSMMTQIDEIENERFMKMTEIEFIQGIARCASILPDACRVQKIFTGKTPLFGKFQWLIHELKRLCSEDIKGQFSTYESIFKKQEEQ